MIYTHSSGVANYLDKCRQGYYVYHAIEHPIDEVRLLGDVALVQGEMNASITSGGALKILRNRSLAVWGRCDGQWKLVAFQATPVNEAQG